MVSKALAIILAMPALVCAMPVDLEMAANVTAAYEKQSWSCEGDLEFQRCAGCEKSCETPPDQSCISACQEKCECPRGTVRKSPGSSTCVPTTQCPFRKISGVCRTCSGLGPLVDVACQGDRTTATGVTSREKCEQRCKRRNTCVGYEWTPRNPLSGPSCELHAKPVVPNSSPNPWGRQCWAPPQL